MLDVSCCAHGWQAAVNPNVEAVDPFVSKPIRRTDKMCVLNVTFDQIFLSISHGSFRRFNINLPCSTRIEKNRRLRVTQNVRPIASIMPAEHNFTETESRAGAGGAADPRTAARAQVPHQGGATRNIRRRL